MSEKMTFEQANAELEKSVKLMESGTLTLEQSVDEYARASRLLAYCTQMLDSYKGRITRIDGEGCTPNRSGGKDDE